MRHKTNTDTDTEAVVRRIVHEETFAQFNLLRAKIATLEAQRPPVVQMKVKKPKRRLYRVALKSPVQSPFNTEHVIADAPPVYGDEWVSFTLGGWPVRTYSRSEVVSVTAVKKTKKD